MAPANYFGNPMLTLVRWIFFAAFVAALVWAIVKPGYDSFAAAVAALAAFIASFFLQKGDTSSSQNQTVSGGVGIQASGDVKVRDIR